MVLIPIILTLEGKLNVNEIIQQERRKLSDNFPEIKSKLNLT